MLRYRTDRRDAVDGLTGREGAFLACSFWLADCLHLIGRHDDAASSSSVCSALSNDLGLLTEEYDPVAKRLVGNFPQAFSHISLVNSAVDLTGHDPWHRGPIARPAARRRIAGAAPAAPRPRHRRTVSRRAATASDTLAPADGPPSTDETTGDERNENVKALTVVPLQGGIGRLDDIDEPPEPTARCWSRRWRSAICGTDVEILSGAYGWAPPGTSGWCSATSRSVGSCEAPAGAPVAAGDLVVGIVRRPDPVPCANCAVGEWDFCRNGQYTERGIKEHDGYCSERYRITPDFVVKVDPRSALSACCSSRPASWPRPGSRWTGSAAGPTGSRRRRSSPAPGPIGLLAALIGVQRGLEVHVIDQMTTGLKPDLVRALGAHLPHRARSRTPVPDPDVVIECTGVAPLVFDAMDAPRARRRGLPDRRLVGRPLHRRRRRRCSTGRWCWRTRRWSGSVNANRRHYEAAAAALAKADRDWLDRLVSRRVPLDQLAEALSAARRRQGGHRDRQ